MRHADALSKGLARQNLIKDAKFQNTDMFLSFALKWC